MTSLILWAIYWVLESPFLVALGTLLVIDELAFGFRVRFYRRWKRNRRAANLELALEVNPHDRRARSELAEILVARKGFAPAVEVLKPNLEAGDHDPATLLLMGRACSGAGRLPQAQVFLEGAQARQTLRDGAADLALGEYWLRAGDAARAEQALRRFCSGSPGSIEGHLLLSRAQSAQGKAADARSSRRQAWRNYVEAPRFVRRRDRLWGWRVRPFRAALLGVIGIAGIGLVSFWVPVLFTRSAWSSASSMVAARAPFEGSRLTIPKAEPRSLWKPRTLELRIRDAAANVERVNLALFAVMRAEAGGQFAFSAEGADLHLECSTCTDPAQGARLLRAIRRITARDRGLSVEIREATGEAPTIAQHGDFNEGDARGYSAFLANQLERDSEQDQTFELEAIVDGGSADLVSAEWRVRASFEEAGRRGLFPFSTPTVEAGRSGRGWEVRARINDDNRTALLVVEVLRNALCSGPGFGGCLSTHIVTQSRIPAIQVLFSGKAESGAGLPARTLDEWFAVEDFLLRECSGPTKPDVVGQRRSIVAHHPEMSSLLHGEAVAWSPDQGQSKMILGPSGDVILGAHIGIADKGGLVFDQGWPNAEPRILDPAAKRVREIADGERLRFYGFVGSAAVTLDPTIHGIDFLIDTVSFGQRVVLRGLDGVDFSFPEFKGSGSGRGYQAVRLPQDKLALVEERGDDYQLVLLSLVNHEVQKLDVFPHETDVQWIAVDHAGRILALLQPRYSAVRSARLATAGEREGPPRSIVRIEDNRSTVVVGEVPKTLRELVAVLHDELWLATGNHDGVVAFDVTGRPAARAARVPSGSEITWALQQGQGLLALAKDGLWRLDGAQPRKVIDREAGAVSGARVSSHGTVAALFEDKTGSHFILVDQSGARAKMPLPSRGGTIEWGVLLDE